MIVYSVAGDTAYKWFAFDRDWVRQHRDVVDGEPLVRSWLRPVLTPSGAGLPSGDFAASNLAGTFIAGPTARDFLVEASGDSIELLPVATPDGDKWLVNATSVINALDEAATEFRVDGAGNRGSVFRHAFNEAIVEAAGTSLFRVPALRRAAVFATELFVNRLKEDHLSGLMVTEVWQSPRPATNGAT